MNASNVLFPSMSPDDDVPLNTHTSDSIFSSNLLYWVNLPAPLPLLPNPFRNPPPQLAIPPAFDDVKLQGGSGKYRLDVLSKVLPRWRDAVAGRGGKVDGHLPGKLERAEGLAREVLDCRAPALLRA